MGEATDRPEKKIDAERARIAVLGIGNPLAGDDGVGPYIVRALAAELPSDSRLLLGVLEGDLLEIADWLPQAEHLLFVDAVAGERPGEIILNAPAPRAWAPSLHQSDVATTLEALRALSIIEPFPTWQLWGVSILPPRELGEGLSPPVEAAAKKLLVLLKKELARLLGEPPRKSGKRVSKMVVKPL